MKRLLERETLQRVEALTGLAAFLITLGTVVWLLWWTGGNLFLAIFGAELAIPLLVGGAAAWAHAQRGQGWARYVLWAAAILALAQAPAMLWMLSFTLGLLLVVVAALASVLSLRSAAARPNF